jgi:hypothetical protein
LVDTGVGVCFFVSFSFSLDATVLAFVVITSLISFLTCFFTGLTGSGSGSGSDSCSGSDSDPDPFSGSDSS